MFWFLKIPAKSDNVRECRKVLLSLEFYLMWSQMFPSDTHAKNFLSFLHETSICIGYDWLIEIRTSLIDDVRLLNVSTHMLYDDYIHHEQYQNSIYIGRDSTHANDVSSYSNKSTYAQSFCLKSAALAWFFYFIGNFFFLFFLLLNDL